MISIKNTIEYFYKISNIELHQKNGINSFYFDSQEFIFIPTFRTELELFEINQVIKNDFSYDQLVLNINNSFLTLTPKGYFVLIKKSGKNYLLEKEIIRNNRIVDMDNNYLHINRTNWQYLWSKKIDYIEYQLYHIENKYPIISKSINYYIGMTESAISYLNNFIVKKNEQHSIFFVISHNRILHNNFNLPTNIIIDYRARDIAEYLKLIFLDNIYDYDKIKIFLKNCNLTYFDSLLIYARLIYPNFYFDLYDQIVNGFVDEKEVLSIINRSCEYENFVNSIYFLLNSKHRIPMVSWL